MTKDEELKEAREWVEQKDLEGDLSFTYRDLAELCIAYHRHRLETDRDKFKQTEYTLVQADDGATAMLTAEEAIRLDAKIRERQIPQNFKGTK